MRSRSCKCKTDKKQQNKQPCLKGRGHKRAHLEDDIVPAGRNREVHKRRRLSAKEEEPDSRSDDSGSEDVKHPIAYWSQCGLWPKRYFREGESMKKILARKRSISSRSRKNSDAASVTPSSTTPSDQKPRDEKSAEYRDPRYKILLATKGVHMEKSKLGITDASKTLCQELFKKEQKAPSDTLFDYDIFDEACKMIEDRNEAKVIQDIARLIVPSAQSLANRVEKVLKDLISFGLLVAADLSSTHSDIDQMKGIFSFQGLHIPHS